MNQAEIDATPDDDVEWLIIDHLIERVGAQDGGEEGAYAFVKGLKPALQMMWGTFMVDGEVNNGGFNQFFWNSSGQYVVEGIDGFRLIGAVEHAEVVEAAVKLFMAELDELRPSDEVGTLDALAESYGRVDFGELDTRYRGLPDIGPMRVRYIRKHPADFAF